jgi:hypothetical protein
MLLLLHPRRSWLARRGKPLLDQGEDRLALLDDIGGQLGRVAAADVAHRVDHSGRDGQGLTGVECLRRLVFDLILQRPFQDIDDFLARMGVL